MMRRCFNPADIAYSKYGAKGVTVCLRYQDFAKFLADLGVRPEGTTLDRKDGALGYVEGNLRWRTQKEQQNNRSDNTRLTWQGKTLTLAEWQAETGISQKLLSKRSLKGWPIERVMEPVVE